MYAKDSRRKGKSRRGVQVENDPDHYPFVCPCIQKGFLFKEGGAR